MRLQQSEDPKERVGGLRLRQFQADLRWCTESNVLLKAPTASGKTLAFLLRSIESFPTTLIVYPTNALIWDQARALHNLISNRLNKRANLTVESDESIRWISKNSDPEVDLYVLNGETLGALAQESHTSEGRALVNQFRAGQAEHRIILTNPEILYYIFLYKFARTEDLVNLIFNEKPPNLLVIDEFHLYYGFSLATTVHMLAYIRTMFDQVILSSATPVEPEEVISARWHTISAKPSDTGDRVRYPMTLELEGTAGPMREVDIPQIKQHVEMMWKKSEKSPCKVKTLVILSSVMTCAKLSAILEKEYPGQVSAIHGLAPQQLRPKSEEDLKPVVIGTSAVEVGIDFDAASLIFEAYDSGSFIQRIGRGARHNECDTIAFVHGLCLGTLKEALASQKSLTPLNLADSAYEFLPHLSTYGAFSKDSRAAPVLLALLLNWVFERPAGIGPISDGVAIQQLSSLLRTGGMTVPKQLEPLKDRILRILEERNVGGDVLQMARKMSCRSTLETLPAIFTDRSPYQFDRLSIGELPKLKFEIVARDFLQRENVKIPWRMRAEERLLKVRGVREKEERVRIDFKPGRFEEPTPLTHFKIVAQDPDLEDSISRLVDRQPACLLWQREDWRFPGFYTNDRRFLVVGGDAYVAWFVKDGLGTHGEE